MDQIILLIAFYSACIGFVWVDILTTNRGLLDFIPLYYPEKLRDKPLMCSQCFSGWLAMFWSLISLAQQFGYQNIYVYIYTVFCGCIAMTVVNFVKR